VSSSGWPARYSPEASSARLVKAGSLCCGCGSMFHRVVERGLPANASVKQDRGGRRCLVLFRTRVRHRRAPTAEAMINRLWPHEGTTSAFVFLDGAKRISTSSFDRPDQYQYASLRVGRWTASLCAKGSRELKSQAPGFARRLSRARRVTAERFVAIVRDGRQPHCTAPAICAALAYGRGVWTPRGVDAQVKRAASHRARRDRGLRLVVRHADGAKAAGHGAAGLARRQSGWWHVVAGQRGPIPAARGEPSQ